MNKLQQQLLENKGKIKRDKFLSKLDQDLYGFFSAAEFSSDPSCIDNAAFPSWNEEGKTLTSSRGRVKGWNNFKFKSWQDLISLLKKFSKVRNYIGWFFVEADGPYYRISLNAFLDHIDGLSEYANKQEKYDFGWVGQSDDVGIIIGHHPANSPQNGDKQFEISIWGM